MRPRRRLAMLLLAMAGVLISHTLGYALAHLDAASRAAALRDHGYLVVLSWLVTPAALAAMGWLAVRAARAAGPALRLSRLRLTASMLALLAVQEVGEGVVAGRLDDVAHEPGVWWSAALSVLVALVLVGLVRSAAWVVERLAGERAPLPTPVRWSRPAQPILAAVPLPSPVAVRGPPERRRP